MPQPIALPQNLAHAAQQQAMAEAQARAVIEGLACGLYEKMAIVEIRTPQDQDEQDRRLRECADFAVKAAVVMGQKLGYCRRTPAAPPG